MYTHKHVDTQTHSHGCRYVSKHRLTHKHAHIYTHSCLYTCLLTGACARAHTHTAFSHKHTHIFFPSSSSCDLPDLS